MGWKDIVGKVVRRALRPVKNFAVEARAEKVLAKDKPTPAPWHPSTQKRIDELLKDSSTFLEEQSKKDGELDSRLKNVYVTSQDPIEQVKRKADPNKPLPMSRDNVEFPDLGYHEPIKVSKGKLSIRQALLLIGKHQQDPTVNTPMRLANEFTLHPTVTTNIVKYFRTFQLYQPEKAAKVKLSIKDYIKLPDLGPREDTPAQLEDGKTKS